MWTNGNHLASQGDDEMNAGGQLFVARVRVQRERRIGRVQEGECRGRCIAQK